MSYRDSRGSRGGDYNRDKERGRGDRRDDRGFGGGRYNRNDGGGRNRNFGDKR